MNEVVEINGKEPMKPAEPPRVEGRRYCDTCRFSQFVLAAGNGAMICRAYGPQVIGGVLVVNQGGQQAAQILNNTYWPGVSREDWCPKHEPDARGARVPVPANDSSIVQAS